MRKECVYAHPTVCIITPIVKFWKIRYDKTFLWKLNKCSEGILYNFKLQILGEKKKNFDFIADDICLFILVKLKCLEKQD